jgi:hypothetical protein
MGLTILMLWSFSLSYDCDTVNNSDSPLNLLIQGLKADSVQSHTCITLMGQYIRGKRSRSDIVGTIYNNLYKLKTTYNLFNKNSNNLNGSLFVNIQILSSGVINKATVFKSTMNDSTFEKQILRNILKWKFSNILEQNDTTEIIYPFGFSK